MLVCKRIAISFNFETSLMFEWGFKWWLGFVLHVFNHDEEGMMVGPTYQNHVGPPIPYDQIV